MFAALQMVAVICISLSSALVAVADSAEDVNQTPEKVTTLILPMHPRDNIVTSEGYFFSRVLALALEKTAGTDGGYRLLSAKIMLSENRLKAALRSGHIDVIWSPTSPEFEKVLLPVRVSLLKEFSDYRILIIRGDDQARYNHIKTVTDLREFSGGMNSHWADMAVMEVNQLPVVSAGGYGRLFRMLKAKRFDYFSRGLYQVKREVDMYPNLQLTMEENLMLYYPSPHYFFVNRDNPALAERIERGLKLALADGSFDKLFFSVPTHQWARDELERNQRHMIILKTP